MDENKDSGYLYSYGDHATQKEAMNWLLSKAEHIQEVLGIYRLRHGGYRLRFVTKPNAREDDSWYDAVISYRYDGQHENCYINTKGSSRAEVLEDARKQALDMLEDGIRFDITWRKGFLEALPA